MRKVIVVDPSGKTDYKAILVTTEPREGEFVELSIGDRTEGGKVTNVRVNPAWPSTWLYDVVV